MSTLKEYINNKQLVTNKVNQYIALYSKGHICSMIGMSRPTLSRRLEDNGWKMDEIKTIIAKLNC